MVKPGRHLKMMGDGRKGLFIFLSLKIQILDSVMVETIWKREDSVERLKERFGEMFLGDKRNESGLLIGQHTCDEWEQKPTWLKLTPVTAEMSPINLSVLWE